MARPYLVDKIAKIIVTTSEQIKWVSIHIYSIRGYGKDQGTGEGWISEPHLSTISPIVASLKKFWFESVE